MSMESQQLIKAQIEATKANTESTKAYTKLLLAQAEELNIRNANNPPPVRRAAKRRGR